MYFKIGFPAKDGLTHAFPNAQILASSSSMNRQENTRLTTPRTKVVVSAVWESMWPSHASEETIRSAKIEEMSRDTSRRME